MAILLSLIAGAIAFGGGWGVFGLLWRSSSFSRAERYGAAIVLGVGLVSASSFLFGLLIDGWALRLTVSALCLGALVLGLKREPAADAAKQPRFAASSIVTSALIAATLVFVGWISLFHTDLGWDGLFNWEAKSRAAFLNRGAFPLSAFSSGLSHSRYPLLVPLFGAWIYGWMGQIDQSVIQLVGPLFYLATLLLLVGSSRRLTGNSWAGALAVILLVGVPQILIGGGSATSGYADWPLALIYFCGLLAVYEYTRTGARGAARFAGAVLALGVWTKADMIVLLVCVAAIVASRVLRDQDWRTGMLILSPPLLTYALWSLTLRLTHATPDGDFQLQPHVDRVPALLRHLVDELTVWKSWSLFWPLLGLASLVVVLKGRRYAIPWVGGVFLPALLYSLVFVFSAWSPVEVHVSSALSRLLEHVAPAGTLLIVLAAFVTFERNPRQDDVASASSAVRRQAGAPALDPSTEALILSAADILQATGLTADDLRELYRRKSPSRSALKRRRRAGV
jgi:hypothetical protein